MSRWTALGGLLLLGAWAALASRWPPHVLPGPARVLETAWEQRVALLDAATRTSGRVVGGYAAAVCAGTALALVMRAWPSFGRQAEPLVSMLGAIPPFAWTPLLLLWVGIGDGSAMIVVFAGAVFPILRLSSAGLAAAPAPLLVAARNLGATEAQVVRRVVVPAALPSAFAGLRQGWTLAWMSVVAAELVGADGGLGQLILDARNLARPDVALVGMGCIGVLATVTDGALAALERRALRWRA